MSKSEHHLEFLFHPRSIAVVGASTMPGPGSGFITAIKETGFRGRLYPVNPKADEIQGLKCYPRLSDVPGKVDYVISSVPVAVVPELMEDLEPKGVKAVHFFTAGFKETGDEARTQMEQEVLRRARGLGVRIIGPNCMGLYSPKAGLSFMPGMPPEPGPVALISQSGANAGDFSRTGRSRGLRFSKVISYGNALDLDESDFFDYCAQDPATEVIASYIEGVKDGRRFLPALRKAAKAKPVIILKGGRTEAGGRATVSHTGSLAGGLSIFDAACRQAGALRVDGMEELVDCSVAFRFVKDLAGPRAALVGVGGGNSVLSADAADAAGLKVPPLSEKIQRALGEFTPLAGTSVRNPIDTPVGFGPDGPRLMTETLRLVSEAKNIDFILYQAAIGFGPPGANLGDPVEQARSLADYTAGAMERFGKPIVLVVRAPLEADAAKAVAVFQEEAALRGLPCFPSVARAGFALRAVLDWQRRRR